MFCQNMLEIAVELASHDNFYQDMAIKFMDHLLWIGRAMNQTGAHVPAEQSAPRKDARFPAAHAHPRRACRARRAQAKGPRQAERLILPAQSRLRRSAEFSLAVRGGSRVGRPTVVGHLLVDRDRRDDPPKIGFVVSRAVGSAVVRNRVKRRLRELMRGYLQLLPGGSLLVVRANPMAARADQSDLAADLGLVISKLMRRQVGADVGNAR